MATDPETVAGILEQLRPLDVRSRPMFGEHGLYCDDTFVGVICRDTLFLKRNAVTDGALGLDALAAPYEGAKDHHVVSAERLRDEGDLVRDAVAGAAEVLPKPRRRSRS